MSRNTSRRNQWFWIVGFSLCLAFPSSFFGQATNSAVSGLVRDPSQAVIAGATVTVTNVETGITRTRETDSAGRYRVGELQPGTYQITVTMPGFTRETHRDIVLMVGQELSLNFTLQVGAVEQEVVVTGEAPLVETSTATLSTAVSQEQLRELPLNGRSFNDLITLDSTAMTPVNASTNTNYTNSRQLSVAGVRTDANNFMLDGTIMNPTHGGSPGSAAGVQLGVDTVREFQVVTTNAKAEHGRGAGAIINAVTRSGTNEWHGSAFEFLRNKALDARNFFNPGELPPFKRNQFGATFGGPIRRDQSFFFLAYEGWRERLTKSRIFNVLTEEARRGILPNRTVEVDPRIVPYVNLYPLPNGGDLGGGIAEFVKEESERVTENFGSARIDHHFSPNDFLFGRYTISRGERVTPSALLTDSLLVTANQYVTLQEDHIFGPYVLNTFRVGFNRSLTDNNQTEIPGTESLNFIPGKLMGEFSGGDLSSIGNGGDRGKFEVQNAFQFEDNLTYTRGSHIMKFGASVTRFQWNTDQPNHARGTWTFDNVAGLLQLGNTEVEAFTPETNTYRHNRTTLLAFFAQDDYRIKPNLMLNVGLRWEFTTGLSEKNGLLAYMPKGWILTGYDELATGEAYENRIRTFQPRLGFNWGLDEDQKTVLSGGFGIFHNPLLHNTFISARAQLPFVFRATLVNVDASKFFPDIIGAIREFAFAGAAFRETRVFDFHNFKTPTLYRYNLGLQRKLPGEMALRVTYVGSLGRHIQRRSKMNVWPEPIRRADGSLFFPPESEALQYINPDFEEIDWVSSDVNSSYNGLAVNLQKRFSRGLTFQTSYTWSKSLDDYSSSESNFEGQGPKFQYPRDRSLDRGRSSFNVPHVFVFNGLYELPLGPGKPFLNTGGGAAAILGGWQLGGIVTIQQGVPFSVTSRARTKGYRWTPERPNLKPGIDVNRLTGGVSAGCNGVNAGEGGRARFFDPCAFTVPDAGTIGNAARNLLLGPALSTVNFTLSKSFQFGERTRLQFRSEFFNLFNHTNFQIPSARVFTSTSGRVSGSAGRITSTATTARQIQFGLKLTF